MIDGSRLIKKFDFLCVKNNKNLVNFDPSTESPKNLHFEPFR